MWQAIKDSMLSSSLGRLLTQNVHRVTKPFSTLSTVKTRTLLQPKVTTNVLLEQTRHFDDCLEKEKGKDTCSSALLTKDPCGKEIKKEPKKKKEKEGKKEEGGWKLKSMWEIADCERKVLCYLEPRYDVLHYRISDKSKRKYQVTWIECPKILIKPKKVCVYDQIKKPKIPRRKRPYLVSKTACKVVDPMPCPQPTIGSKCPRVTMPCCKPARIPPLCERTRFKTDCTKKKTPYPSFSECKKEPPIPAPPTECKCLDTPALCEAWAELRRRLALGMTAKFKCP